MTKELNKENATSVTSETSVTNEVHDDKSKIAHGGSVVTGVAEKAEKKVGSVLDSAGKAISDAGKWLQTDSGKKN